MEIETQDETIYKDHLNVNYRELKLHIDQIQNEYQNDSQKFQNEFVTIKSELSKISQKLSSETTTKSNILSRPAFKKSVQENSNTFMNLPPHNHTSFNSFKPQSIPYKPFDHVQEETKNGDQFWNGL